MSRPNLDVVTLAQVHARPLRRHARDRRGLRPRAPRSHRVDAGEVVLCGGAINSPQLLQLSGVGAADELRALGIGVVADLPGVGENLQDHLEVYVQHACTQPVSMAPYFAMKRPAAGRGGVDPAQDRARVRPTTSRPAASSAPTTTSPTRT